jgi:endonuclease III
MLSSAFGKHCWDFKAIISSHPTIKGRISRYCSSFACSTTTLVPSLTAQSASAIQLSLFLRDKHNFDCKKFVKTSRNTFSSSFLRKQTMPVTTRRQQQQSSLTLSMSVTPTTVTEGIDTSVPFEKKGGRRIAPTSLFSSLSADDDVDNVVSHPTRTRVLTDCNDEKGLEQRLYEESPPKRQRRLRFDNNSSHVKDDTIIIPAQTRKRTSKVLVNEVNVDAATAAASTTTIVASSSRLINVVTPEPVLSTSVEELAGPTNDDIEKGVESMSMSVPQSKTKKATRRKTSTTTVGSTKRSATITTKATSCISPPSGWEDIYSLVEELRSDRTAPCDIDGCEALVNRINTTAANQRFQVLIALMLSSQTKDAVVGHAIRSMQQDNVLDVESIVRMDVPTLDSYIAKVGFHNTKTKHIHQVVRILQDRYQGDIPPTAADMIRDLPGVGPKMAYICESAAWNSTANSNNGISTGIGVDTHMHRLFTCLQWVDKATCTTPEHTRIQLQQWLPHDKWSNVNLLWVGFGQELQQYKLKILQKAMKCSRPIDALQLLDRCGLDYVKEGKKLGLYDEIKQILSFSPESILQKPEQ